MAACLAGVVLLAASAAQEAGHVGAHIVDSVLGALLELVGLALYLVLNVLLGAPRAAVLELVLHVLRALLELMLLVLRLGLQPLLSMARPSVLELVLQALACLVDALAHVLQLLRAAAAAAGRSGASEQVGSGEAFP